MKYFFKLLIFLAASVQSVHAMEKKFITSKIYVQINIAENKIVVVSNQKIIQEITFDASRKDAMRFIEFNFDGFIDLQILRDRGIEEYFDVYLFDSKEKKFFINKKLSELPCPLVSKKEKIVIGSCFVASACDRWEETYRWAASDLVLTEKKGTYCDPGNGKSYSYREIYSGDKLIKKTVTRLKSK